MTPAQIAVNSRAIRNAADRLEAAGFTGDSTAFVETLITGAIADGWRTIDKPPAVRGPGARPETIAAAKAAVGDAVRRSKEMRGAKFGGAV